MQQNAPASPSELNLGINKNKSQYFGGNLANGIITVQALNNPNLGS